VAVVVVDEHIELTMRSGDRLPLLSVAVEDDNGNPADLTEATSVFFVLRHEDGIWPLTTDRPAGAPVVLTLPGYIADPVTATVVYDWEELLENLIAGDYDLSVVVHYSTGGTLTAPSDNIGRVHLRPRVLPLNVSGNWDRARWDETGWAEGDFE